MVAAYASCVGEPAHASTFYRKAPRPLPAGPLPLVVGAMGSRPHSDPGLG